MSVGVLIFFGAVIFVAAAAMVEAWQKSGKHRPLARMKPSAQKMLDGVEHREYLHEKSGSAGALAGNQTLKNVANLEMEAETRIRRMQKKTLIKRQIEDKLGRVRLRDE